MRNQEDILQSQCVAWLRYQHPKVLFFHPKNEGNRGNVMDGVRGKKIGVLAGVADLMILEPDLIGYHGIFIEFKTEKGRQSEAQKRFEIEVTARDYVYHVCRSFEGFREIIKNYL